MGIVIFSDITTESALRQLKEAGEKYKGLFVDMNNKDERKFAKEQASTINDMLKRLDRKRIDTKKEYSAKVEAEAKHIRERLQEANAPYNDLIEAHKAERKAILDAEKERQAAIDLRKQIESDHEIAIIMNDHWDLEKETRERERAEAQRLHDEEVARQAIENQRLVYKRKAAIAEAERLKRIVDLEHVRSVNREAVESLVSSAGVDEYLAMRIIRSIVNGEIKNVSIEY